MQVIKDDQITRTVYNKLAARGFGSLGHLSVQTNDGLVTLVGTVRYAHQKTAALTAISGIGGIRRVIDQLTVRPQPPNAVKRPRE